VPQGKTLAFVLTFLAAAAILGCSKGGARIGTPFPTAEVHADVAAATVTSVPTPLATVAPAADRIKVAATTGRQYYTVYGSNSDELLSYVENYGPVDDKGVRGTGVTLYKTSLNWDSNRDPRACAIATMTIQVDLQVVLPILDSKTSLDVALGSYWVKFAAGVAAHEQRHVDIYLQGADAIREKMLAIQPTLGCTALESAVNDVWSSQHTLTDQEQERFHAAERTRIEAARAPLKSQLDADRNRLDVLSAQVSGLDSSLGTLSAQLDQLKGLLDTVKTQITAVEDKYQTTTAPPDVYQQYQTLLAQYNNLIPAYNALVDQLNRQVSQRAALVAQSDDLRDQSKALADQYNWTQ
jgi:predicted secreted Zn-dependent protease/uncharacterized protein YukE